MDFRFVARVVAGLLALPIAALAWSAPPTLTLDVVTRQAAERAPLLEARSASVEAAQAEAARAGALPEPMLMFGIDNLPVTGSDAFDVAADEMTMKRVGVRQEFPAGARRQAQRELALREVDAARASAIFERRAVQRQAAEAWIDVWAAGHRLHALQGLREQAQLATRLARARVVGGAGSAADALAAEAAVLEIDNAILAAQAEQQAALAQLTRWVPLPADDVATPDVDFTMLPIPEAQLRARIEDSAPLLTANAEVELAAAATSSARTESRPDWNVAAYYGQRDGGRSDMVGVEVGVSLPWLASRRVNSGVQAREADYRAALATRESERQALSAEIEAALARWHGLQRQVDLHAKSLLPLARDRSAAALAAYRAGGELQPWLDARRAELEVHLSHADHLGELGRAWAALAYLLPEESTP
jgi:cobalt-zinc-cadmium efflux system outer membrane protein